MTKFVKSLIVKMKKLGRHLYAARKSKGLTLSGAVKETGVDAGLISKFEHGKRLPSLANLTAFAQAYQLSFPELKKLWLAEKVVDLVQYEADAAEILALAESRVEYLAGEKALKMDKIPSAVQEKLSKIDTLKAKWGK